MDMVNMIVAAGRDGAIGRGGDLIWRISADLRRFKALTMGHPVIMGRKTWESLPKRPLPGRLNVVLTRDTGYVAPGALVAGSPEEALAACGYNAEVGGPCMADAEPFVMGGALVYESFMPFVGRIYLTEIDDVCEDADARLPFPPDHDMWRVEETGDREVTDGGVVYRYVTYVRV